MVSRREHVELPQRIQACDGWVLNRKLNGWLKDPATSAITIVVYRYHDLDWNLGRVAQHGQAGLISDLANAADRGVSLTFVTRDPLSSGSEPMETRSARGWYQGLKRLSMISGTRVLIHTSLHAKVYLVERRDGKVFYAVGSSNLTYQAMGFRWAECNVIGYTRPEYEEVEKRVGNILQDRGNLDLAGWKLKVSKDIRNTRFIASLG